MIGPIKTYQALSRLSKGKTLSRLDNKTVRFTETNVQADVLVVRWWSCIGCVLVVCARCVGYVVVCVVRSVCWWCAGGLHSVCWSTKGLAEENS